MKFKTILQNLSKPHSVSTLFRSNSYPLKNSHSLFSRFSPKQAEKVRENDLSDFQGFGVWQAVCEQILAKPFPPQSSDFSSNESLERDSHFSFTKLSNWEIVCQEILDTEYSHVYYQRCYDELRRRGKSEQEIFEMRRFAWQTAGWLNYPMMVWDWTSLDESDIRRAIEWLCMIESKSIKNSGLNSMIL